MKYIVIKTTKGEISQEHPIIFPKALVHSEIFKGIKSRLMKTYDKTEIVSAGSYSSFECYGKSTSLGIESRGEIDTILITSIDYTHGICYD